MKLRSNSFAQGDRIPATYAFGKPGVEGPFATSDNRNPHLAWEGAPAGTRSYAVICVDGDVPSRGDDVNKPDRLVPADLPRVDFYHWVLVDLPPSVTELQEGSHADGVVARGKAPGPAPVGLQGLNDYTGWFAGDPDMGGDYAGYDGPCPPWNDSILHHYRFQVFALDLPGLGLTGAFTGAEALAAMEGHVLARAELMGTYAMNPRL